MGFFDGAKSLAGPVLNYIGQSNTNKQNKGIGRDQMSWQQENSDTSYVRAAADLKEAGINPILAGQFGGASTPASALATMKNPLEGANDFVTNAKTIQDTKASKAKTAQIKLDNLLKQKDIPVAEMKRRVAQQALDLLDKVSEKDNQKEIAETIGKAFSKVPGLEGALLRYYSRPESAESGKIARSIIQSTQTKSTPSLKKAK